MSLGYIDWVPDVALLPLQLFEAVQEVELVEDQVSVTNSPRFMELLLVVRVICGAFSSVLVPVVVIGVGNSTGALLTI